ncbi:MAG: lysophospholipid acyltransferase family protein, partial [Candidatus Omnitrophica bacterium]|nr:lysophospholipid acyltransferase family protein [Candidatus Omnitrophota bacterium]
LKKEEVSFETKEVFRHFGRYLVEFFRMEPSVDKEFIQEHVVVHNEQYIKEVLQKGRGGIFLTAHIGNWELGAAVLSLLGYPVTVVALPHKHPKINDFFNRQRRIKGLDVVATDQAIDKCTDALQRNECIAVAGERAFGAKGEWIDFLGRKVLIPNGPALFAMKTGAFIIPSFLIRKGNDQFEFFIDKPIDPQAVQGRTTKEKKQNIMKQYVACMEKMIQQYPSQWLMFREYGTE